MRNKKLKIDSWQLVANTIRVVCITGVFGLWSVVCCSQDRTRILFVLDASLSMKNEWKGGNKWEVAKSALIQIADSLAVMPNVEMGVRVFGHLYQEPDKNCHDTRLEVRIDTNNVKDIKRKLDEIRPKGITPLVYTLEKAVGDFGGIPARNIIIIITDGEDACNRDPCSVVAMLQKNNILLRPYIIGMSVQANSFQEMMCMGKLFNTNSAAEFSSTLIDVVNESITKTTSQINLNDESGKPTESNVNMTFYDLETGLPVYNFYHTMNSRGLPDTLILSSEMKYKLQVHTIPPVVLDSLTLRKTRHNIVELHAPQGYLNFTLQGLISKSAAIERIKCLVHQSGETKTLHVQQMNSKEKYLIGTYDLEILTLPRTLVKNVKIEQSKTTDVLIPSPGIVTLNKTFEVYGGIFMVANGRMKKIYELHLKDKQETIAIQPGKYRIVYRSKSARTIHTTVEKEFEVTSGGSLSLRI